MTPADALCQHQLCSLVCHFFTKVRATRKPIATRMLPVAMTAAWAEVEMVTVHNGRTISDKLGRPIQGGPGTRRQWVTPTWKRLETPMEVTMYAGRR